MSESTASEKSDIFPPETAVVLKGLQTIFGDVHERKVVFCIDTSGSMFEVLPSVKENLLETLLKMSYREGDSEFNLISFSSAVEQWSDSLVKCNPGTVRVAAKWINQLQPISGTNTLDALLCAFKSNPEAVYLVTDGLPDQDGDTVLDHIAYIAKGRPVHAIHIFKGTPDKDTCAFLKELAKETFGSFSMVAFARHGCIERITPIHGGVQYQEQIIRTNNGNIYPNLSNCSVTTRLHGDPLQDPVFTAPGTVSDPQTGVLHPYYHPQNHWYWWGLPVPGAYGPYMYNPYYSWSRYRASRSYMTAHEKLADASEDSRVCPTSSVLLIGRIVLARRFNDGFYYKGTVKSQTDPHRFVVEFGPVTETFEVNSEFEEIHVSDIIGWDDAFRHPLLPGDRCLAPVESKTCVFSRYEPATVMEGSERRAGKVPEDKKPLVVALSSGSLTSIPAGIALWIPNAMFHRLALESKMPRKARQKLAEVPGYPLVSHPGYPVNVDIRFPDDYITVKPKLDSGRPMFVDHLLPPYYLPVHPMFDIQSEAVQSRMTRGIDLGSMLEMKQKHQSVDHQAEALHAKVREQINMHNETNANSSVKGEETKEAEEEKEKEEEEKDEKEEDEEDFADSGIGCTNSPEMDECSVCSEPAKPLISRPRQQWRNFSKGSIPTLSGAPEHDPYLGSNNSSKNMHYDRFAILSEFSDPSPPPRSRSAWQPSGPLGDVSSQAGRHELARETRESERMQFRRNRVLQREEQRQSRLAAAAAAEAEAAAGARERRGAQLERFRARQAEDAAALERTREQKRAVTASIRGRQPGPDQAERDVRKVEMMRQRREQREGLQRERAEQLAEHRRKVELARLQNNDSRWRQVHDRLEAEEAACRRQDLVAREVERQRLTELRRLEERQQRLRDLDTFSRRQNEAPLA